MSEKITTKKLIEKIRSAMENMAYSDKEVLDGKKSPYAVIGEIRAYLTFYGGVR